MTETERTAISAGVSPELPRVLLVANGIAGSPGVGEEFLGELARCFPARRLSRCSLVTSGPVPCDGWWRNAPVHYCSAPSSILPLASTFREWHFWKLGRRRVVEEIAERVRLHGCDLIWFVLNSTGVIALARPLAAALGRPYVATVWDPPEYFARNMRFDPATSRMVLAEFGRTLRGALRVSVMSEDMADAYEADFGARVVMMRYGTPQRLWRDQRTHLLEDGVVRIGFAGSLYAKQEWNALIAALKLRGGRIEGRRVEVRFFGWKPRSGMAQAEFVRCCGVCSFDRTIEQLSRVDVCYLPYWFSPSRERVARFSFPAKLSTYIAAGAPVFMHCPQYASPARFHKEYPVGVCCDSLDPAAIAEALCGLVRDESLRVQAAEARRAALTRTLNAANMRQAFLRLMGIPGDRG